MPKISPIDENQIITSLSKLKPGFLPIKIFHAIARLMIVPTYIIIPLFMDKGELKVQLLKRGPDDVHWPNMWNLPGKIILSTDKTLDTTKKRVLCEEMPSERQEFTPIFCGNVFARIPRGKEVSIINYVVLANKPKDGKLFPINNLPDNLIKTEIPRIKMAAKAYLKSIK